MQTYKFRCRKCASAITVPVVELTRPDLLSGVEQEEAIPRGHFAINTGKPEGLLGFLGHWIANLEDLTNTKPHWNLRRSVGCCGPSGAHGLNTVCPKGHPIGTVFADCYMSHFVDLDPDRVDLVTPDTPHETWIARIARRFFPFSNDPDLQRPTTP